MTQSPTKKSEITTLMESLDQQLLLKLLDMLVEEQGLNVQSSAPQKKE